MRFPALVLVALLALPAAAAAQDIAEGWYLTSGLSGGNDVGYTPRTTPPRLEAGTGVTAGMSGPLALYVRGKANLGIQPCRVCQPQESFIRFGGLERRIPLDAWAGKRLRLSVRLKNEEGAHGYVSAQINTRNGGAIRMPVQMNGWSSTDWQAHNFVVDVPENAKALIIDTGFSGEGTVWLENPVLEAVGAEVPVTRARSGRWGCAGEDCEVIAMPDHTVGVISGSRQ